MNVGRKAQLDRLSLAQMNRLSLDQLDRYACKVQTMYRTTRHLVTHYKHLQREAEVALKERGSRHGWRALVNQVNHYYALARWYSLEERNARDHLEFVVSELRRRREAHQEAPLIQPKWRHRTPDEPYLSLIPARRRA